MQHSLYLTSDADRWSGGNNGQAKADQEGSAQCQHGNGSKNDAPPRKLSEPGSQGHAQQVALIGFRGGEARTGQLGCEHLVREQERE